MDRRQFSPLFRYRHRRPMSQPIELSHKLPLISSHAESSTEQDPLDKEINFYMTSLDREIEELNNRQQDQQVFEVDLPPEEYKRSLETRLISQCRQRVEKTEALRSFLKPKDPVKEAENKKHDLIAHIQRSLFDKRSPCIEDIYFKVSKKSSLFNNYKYHGRAKAVPEQSELNFSYECIANKCSPVPILAHIKENQLVLNRYNMHDPICFGLSASLPDLSHLKSLHLDQCGISDEGGAAILQGISKQRTLKSFYYTKNVIGHKFARAFRLVVSSTELEELN